MFATSLVFPSVAAAIANPLTQKINAADGLYFQGKAVDARQQLMAMADEPGVSVPDRLTVIENLLDICIRTYAAGCVVTYSNSYYGITSRLPADKSPQYLLRNLNGLYYSQLAEYLFGTDPEIITKDYAKVQYPAEDVQLYVKHELFIAQELGLDNDFSGSEMAIDRALSVVASLKNPEVDRFDVASALANVIGTLMLIGDTQRAYGIYASSGNFIAKSLSPQTMESVVFRYNEAELLEEVGDLRGSVLAIEESIRTLRQIELDAPVRDTFLALALTLKAADCAVSGKLDCARDALSEHPYKALYATAGRQAASVNEINYLAARALVSAIAGGADPVAAAALDAPAAGPPTNFVADRQRVLRAVGKALALPRGSGRDSGLVEAGEQEIESARIRPVASFGAWYRPGTLDQITLELALGQIGQDSPDADENAFELFQLEGRRGASFDYDALTVLARAHDDAERRSIHQGLRLRARRDRLEREQLQLVAQRGLNSSPSGGLEYDLKTRLLFTEFDRRIAELSQSESPRDGHATSAENIVTLKEFQAKLRSNEVALYVSGAAGDVAYMCVRRDAAVRKVAPADWQRVQNDSRVLQDALTASYAPSEALDVQFPVSASVRLYDFLIRPFEKCLKPGDHIVWLPQSSMTPVPLAALLATPPPKMGDGYDLAAADWLIRSYSVTYAGAASVISAARSGSRPPTDFDFLGVGDPLLTGVTVGGEDRSKILAAAVRGESLVGLTPLPDTEVELSDSSRGFRRVTLLTQGAATKRNVSNQLLGSYALLSFATHGLVRRDGQGLSDPALVLTPGSADDVSDDGLLTASEIADLNLSARFVSLSACNTANVDFSQMPEDLLALSSAFEVAGVPATLGTLWSVDSETTTRIVSETFAHVRAKPDEGPAQALAEAQRDFLKAPPSRAYLHPRFWAPFVVLGDGFQVGGSGGNQATPRVTSVESLTDHGGEVYAVHRVGSHVLERFRSNVNQQGRFGSAVKVSDPAGREVWRRDNWQTGATGFVTELGSEILASGFQTAPSGRSEAVLEAFDRRSGKPISTWHEDTAAGLDSVLASGIKVDPADAILALTEEDLASKVNHSVHVHVYRIDGRTPPHLIFDTSLPVGFRVSDITISISSDNIVTTYSDRFSSDNPFYPIDSYDWSACNDPTTIVEMHNRKTGLLINSAKLTGITIVTVNERGGSMTFGGATRIDLPQSTCGEMRAAVFDFSRGFRRDSAVFVDREVGQSEIRSLKSTNNGNLIAVGDKDNILNYHEPPSLDKLISQIGTPLRPRDTQTSGIIWMLSNDYTVQQVKTLDAAVDVYLNALDASDPRNILVGGELGDHAAVFHVSMNPQANSRPGL